MGRRDLNLNQREKDHNSSKSILKLRLACNIDLVFVFLACSTYGMECPAEIRLRASEDGQCLVVKSMNEDHNHELSKH